VQLTGNFGRASDAHDRTRRSEFGQQLGRAKICSSYKNEKDKKIQQRAPHRPVVDVRMMAEAWQATAADVAATAIVCAEFIGLGVRRTSSSK